MNRRTAGLTVFGFVFFLVGIATFVFWVMNVGAVAQAGEVPVRMFAHGAASLAVLLASAKVAKSEDFADAVVYLVGAGLIELVLLIF